MMTNDQIAAAAPAVLSRVHAAHLSDKYRFIHTDDVLTRLAEHGFLPVQAAQDRARLRDPNVVRHRVVLRASEPVEVGDTVPQILLVNSHNGRTKLRLFAGLYRAICANGLVVGDHTFTTELAHHNRLAFDVQEFAAQFGAQVARLRDKQDAWSRIELSERQARGFAERAAALRFGPAASAYDATHLLDTHRTADAGRTVWKVYNRIQENATRGGQRGISATGRSIRSRPLTGIGADLAFNQALWTLTEQVAEAA